MTTAYDYHPSAPAPAPPQTPSAVSSSAPGTPLSGISTVAIKDGQEGNRHSTHTKEYVSTTDDRLSRLGGFGIDRNRNSEGKHANDQANYFERVTGWAKDVERTSKDSGAETSTLIASKTPLEAPTIIPSGRSSTSTATSARHVIRTTNKKSPAPGQILLPPPSPMSTPKKAPPSPMIPNPPCPTPNTPSIVPPQATLPTSLPHPLPRGPRLLSPIYQGLASPPTNTPTTSSSLALSAASTPGVIPSPASTGTSTTTSSIQHEQLRAKMVDGMTYDEGIVDTTMRSPLAVEGVEGEDMDGVEHTGSDKNSSATAATLNITSKMPGYFVGETS